jgi:hypothetical protein
MCPTGRLSSVGTLDRPGEAVCVRLLSSLFTIKNIVNPCPLLKQTPASETSQQGTTGFCPYLWRDFWEKVISELVFGGVGNLYLAVHRDFHVE